MASQALQRAEQVRNRAPEPFVANPVQLHVRDIVCWRGVFYPACSCGWCGVPELTEAKALAVPCEVEGLLALGQWRRKRMAGVI